MSKLSIYETSWIDIIFQDRNKEYGAYQLRQNSTKTSFLALITGITVLCGAITIPRLLNYFSPVNQVATNTPVIIDQIITIANVKPNQPKPMAAIPAVKNVVVTEITKTVQLSKPEIVEATVATPDLAKNIDYKAIAAPITDGTGITGLNLSSSNGIETAVIHSATADNGNAIVNSVSLDKLPEFPGGINKFYAYVGTNFEKPEIDNMRTIRIFVSFIIEKDGKMTDIKVLKDPGYGLGKESIRVLKSLRTKWTPGMVAGQAVRTVYNLPILIQMQ